MNEFWQNTDFTFAKSDLARVRKLITLIRGLHLHANVVVHYVGREWPYVWDVQGEQTSRRRSRGNTNW